jgi:L-seryl-tRNA(Ser) seleniumtransferase
LNGPVAAVIHPAHLDGKPGTLSLEEVVSIARPQDIPVIVDAAYMNYPTSIMGDFVKRGADLVCISAKYFGGPNAGGFIMGRKDLIEAVSNVHFTRYESGDYLKFGRPLKMDRQIVIAVLAALEEWFVMDHESRFAGYKHQVQLLHDKLMGLKGVRLESKSFTMDERFVDDPVNCLLMTIDQTQCSKSFKQIVEHLETSDRPILAIHDGNKIGFVMDVLRDEEVLYIGDELVSYLGGAS